MISEKAIIGENVVIGEYAVIGDNVIIGSECIVGHHVVIHSGTIIGKNVRIDDFTCIGKSPMKALNSAVTEGGLPLPARIDDDVIIGTGAIIYSGSEIAYGCMIADTAVVREDVIIGQKTIVGRGATVENKTTIGSCVKIQTNAYITAYSAIEDNCFIAPCVVTSNDNFAGRTQERFYKYKGVTVKKGGRIGAGAVILPGKTVNEDAFVGAGSVVTKDVESKKIVVGNPARIVADVPIEQLLNNQG